MKLDTEFIKLPFRFDVARLQEEVRQFTEQEWKPHPQGFAGNWAIPLIGARGNPDDDSVKGPMAPTPFLDRCPYLKQVLATFGSVLGRTRLMRLDNKAETTAHVDTNYYWLRHVRIHVPVVTFPEVQFHCGKRHLHMAQGECWLFDTWQHHNVINPTDKVRIHLVADAVGSPEFWEVVRRSERPFGTAPADPLPVRAVAYEPQRSVTIETEPSNFPVVMPPQEQQELYQWIFGEIEQREAGNPLLADVRGRMEHFFQRWQEVWAAHADRPEGWPLYRELLEEMALKIEDTRALKLPNHISAHEAILQAFLRSALNPDLYGNPSGAAPAAAAPPAARRTAPAAQGQADSGEPRIERPVIIVSAPRSGSTLLFETLAKSPDVRTIGGESHRVIEGFPRLRPAARDWQSNRLTAEDANDRLRQLLPRAFLEQMRDARGAPPKGAVRLLEKTPKNALRVPFLKEIFPDARFIYLYREPRGSISSIMDAWRSGKFVTYPDLPTWKTLKWSMLLVPGWRELAGKPLEEIALRQWLSANETLLDDLAQLPSENWCAVDYDNFQRDPEGETARLCAFAGIALPPGLDQALPLSQFTLTPPAPDKWKKNAAELEKVLPRTEALVARAAKLPHLQPIAARPRPAQPAPQAAPQPAAPVPAAPQGPAESPLKSVYTTNLYDLFQRLGCSLLVTTYQAGKLVVIRAKDGALNTHFKLVPKPMGLDVFQGDLALGIRLAVQRMRNVPAVAPKVEPLNTHDACFVPSGMHMTGDIDIHEMAFDRDGQLWIVNTRFCCLCTLDGKYNFTPRWKPPFLTGLAPEDRCHLNGLAVRDGRVRYVSMLAETDAPGAWRAHKAAGGIIMDITNNRVVARGLSMPHSPRWYRDRLWVLESGKGTIGWVDEATGKVETICTLPGFTRGLDFVGPFAFIGLSQVRETAVFSGIPLTEKMGERNCGVWVVNIETGRSVGFVRFEGAVQEIFAVKALAGVRCPEILDPTDKLAESCYILPEEALAQVPRERKVAGA